MEPLFPSSDAISPHLMISASACQLSSRCLRYLSHFGNDEAESKGCHRSEADCCEVGQSDLHFPLSYFDALWA